MNQLELVEKELPWGLSLLKDMVSIPTVNPPGENYREFSALASEVLKSIGFNVDLIEVPREYVAKHRPEYANYPRYIVLGRYGSGEPVLHFNGHYDVVPPGFGWSKKPFEPTIEGGKIYGRGTCDMKGGIAAFLAAAKALVESRLPLKGTIEVALVPDEETGGETGTGYLVKQGLTRPNYVIIGEPSGSDTIRIGHRGVLWFLVEVHGRQSHASRPWLGVNAFEYVVEIAYRLLRDYAGVLELKKTIYEYEDPRAAKAGITLGGEVKCGVKINVVPGYCSFTIDRRILVEERLEEVEREVVEFIERIASKLNNVSVGVKIVGKMPPAITNPESELVHLAAITALEILGKVPRKIVCAAGLDMHYYTECGIHTITYGPGPPDPAHSTDEFLAVEEFEKMAKIYYMLSKKILLSK
ncbi:MAG: M20 family metallopeptidase [Desulfurococcaceae archaeon]